MASRRDFKTLIHLTLQGVEMRVTNIKQFNFLSTSLRRENESVILLSIDYQNDSLDNLL